MSKTYCDCGDQPQYQPAHRCDPCQVETEAGCSACWLCGQPMVPGRIAIRISSDGIADTLGATA